MDQQEETVTVEQLQKLLLDAEKSGEYAYEELLPIWEEAKGVIEDEEQMVSLYTTFIYLTRRFVELGKNGPDYSKVEEIFLEGLSFLEECFEGYSDASIRFEKNFAYFYYTKLKKIEQAREIWNKLLEAEQSAFPWLEAISLERAYGDIDYARRLFFKALDAVTYRQEEIFSRFVQFEREEGTRDQLDLALARVNAKATAYNTWMKQQKQQQKIWRPREKNEQKTTKKKEKGAEKKKAAIGARKGQRRTEDEEEEGDDQRNAMEVVTKPIGGQSDEAGGPKHGTNEEIPAATFETSSVPMGPILPGVVPSTDQTEEKIIATKEISESTTMAAGKRKRPPSNSSESAFPYNTSLEKNKLFVKKLDWACTGEELRKFFEKFGTVLDARIVTKWNGRSKGCAYVDFADEQSASAALMGADGAEIRGRKITVFLSNPPPVKRAKMLTTSDQNLVTDESNAEMNTSNTVPTSTEESEQNKRSIQQKKPASFMPRAALLTGGGQRVGRASRLLLSGSSISKIGMVTESTKEMTIQQTQRDMMQ